MDSLLHIPLFSFTYFVVDVILQPTRSNDYESGETKYPSRKVDMLFGKHPFSLQAYFRLILEHQSFVKKSKTSMSPTWEEEHSTLYIKNNLFARLGLLLAHIDPKMRMKNDLLYHNRIICLPAQWGYVYEPPKDDCEQEPTATPSTPSATPRRSKRKHMLKRVINTQRTSSTIDYIEEDVTPKLNHDDLHNSHYYCINLFASLIIGLAAERHDLNCLQKSLLNDNLVYIVASYPRQAADNSILGGLKKTTNHKRTPKFRVYLHPRFSTGALIQSYRRKFIDSDTVEDEGNSIELSAIESLPNWMYPVNYWGKPPSRSHNTNHDEDEEQNENIFEFEEKITNWAVNLTKTLKEKANKRIMKTRQEIEDVSININKLYMGYEDKLASTIRHEYNHGNLLQQQKLWKKKNGGWHKRFYNFMMRKQVEPIVPFNEKQSALELEKSKSRLQWLKERLPSQNMPPGWTSCFTRCVGEPLYDIYESRRQYKIRQRLKEEKQAKSSLRGRGTIAHLPKDQCASVNQPFIRPRQHIRWTKMAGDDYQKILKIRRMNSSLAEMTICGGIRNNVLLARVIVDEEHQPQGTTMLESFQIPHCQNNDLILYMISSRVGFQDRNMCECTCNSYAVTKTSTGKIVSELGLKLLRVELPVQELDNTRLRQKILWKIFKESRYNTQEVLLVVIKLQSIFRRKMALKKSKRMRLMKNRRKAPNKK